MSLQVWLPLNGDLHNQGLYNINPTLNTSNTIFTDNGKLGKKAITTTKETSDGINLPNYMNQLKTFENYSMCAWIYMTDFASGHSSTIISSGAWTQTNDLNNSCVFGLYYKDNNAYQNILIPNLVTWNTRILIPTDKRMSLNKWYHITITYDGVVTKAYINGEYIGQNSKGGITQQSDTTNVRIGSATYTTDYTFNGKMNDVRIYDHCLSATEVAEIAKGLVLHYKLDNNGLGNENYWTNGKPQVDTWTNFQGYSKELRTTFGRISTSYTSSPSAILNEYTEIKFLSTREQIDNGGCQLQKPQRYSNTINGACPILENLKEGEYFTISYELYISSPVNVKFMIGKRLNGTISKNETSLFQVSTINTWTKISQSIQITSDFDKSNITANVDYLVAAIAIQDILGVTTPDEVVIRIRNIKLERGQEATSWTPARADFGHIDDDIIYDCSGYQNNGTIVGELTAAAGSPRYGIATQFPGSAYSKCVSPSAEGQTISVWAKWNSIPSGQSIIYIDYKSKTGLGLMNTGILCSSCGLRSYTFSKATIVANTWYHFVIVCPNGSANATRQLYINGVEQTATSNTSNWSYTIDELQIGKRSTTSDGFNGQLSDFRIYATVLTSEQIADLYHTSMSIDANGNAYTRELVE